MFVRTHKVTKYHDFSNRGNFGFFEISQNWAREDSCKELGKKVFDVMDVMMLQTKCRMLIISCAADKHKSKKNGNSAGEGPEAVFSLFLIMKSNDVIKSYNIEGSYVMVKVITMMQQL